MSTRLPRAVILSEAKAIAQDAWDFADASPEPPLEKLYTNVYADTSS